MRWAWTGSYIDATVFAVIESYALLDGMTCDECGNIYVVEMLGALWQITPTGEVGKVGEFSQGENILGTMITSVNFGSGIGGWRDDYLYIPATTQKNQTGLMIELDLGLKGKVEPHLQ